MKLMKVCIKNDGFCIKNDDFCIKNDDFDGNIKGEEDDETAGLPGLRVPLKQLADVLMTDVGGKIRDDPRIVLVVDPGRQANTFLRYRDCNYLNYCSSRDMDPHSVRLGDYSEKR